MTKEMFCSFYRHFTSFIKQEVNGEYVMNASAHFVDYCGGYELELHPSCLMWGKEFVMLEALCDRFALSMQVTLYDGKILIF